MQMPFSMISGIDEMVMNQLYLESQGSSASNYNNYPTNIWGTADSVLSGNSGEQLSNETLQSFITDSPFSFQNPIFFSVPRDNQTKNNVKPVTSKR